MSPAQLQRLPKWLLRAIRDRVAIDDLTGVLRRASGLISGEREISRARRAGSYRVVAAFLDVDGLKAINDFYGHAAGDMLLKGLSDLLKARLRGQDLIFRYGGDEFVCLLVDTDIEGARALTDELRRHFASHFGQQLSVGLAELTGADDMTSLIARADNDLYAKRKRGTVARQGSDEESNTPNGNALDVGSLLAQDAFEDIQALLGDDALPTRATVAPILRAAHEHLGLELLFISGDEMRRLSGAIPVKLNDGSVCGALYCTNKTRVSRRDRQFLDVLARLVGRELDEVRTADPRRGEHVRRIVDAGLISAALQPIVDVQTAVVVGMEALARFPFDTRGGPDLLFAEAEMAGLGTELELLAFQAAGDRVRDVPDAAYLSVNVSPALALAPTFGALLETMPLDRLVVEITEHARIDDYAAIRLALSRARLQGLRLAIDDAGAGFASFNHILALAPDIIKLDVGLIHGVDQDASRRSFVASMLNFGRQIGVDIIAEGIETRGELEALRELGVRYGQGFLLGKPTVSRPPQASASSN